MSVAMTPASIGWATGVHAAGTKRTEELDPRVGLGEPLPETLVQSTPPTINNQHTDLKVRVGVRVRVKVRVRLEVRVAWRGWDGEAWRGIGRTGGVGFV